MDRPVSVPIHEATDVGGLDVLLNACKPTLLDSKPPIRLNVIQEANPPEALVKNLQKTLGVKIEEVQGGGKSKVAGKLLPVVDSSFTYKPKEKKKRLHVCLCVSLYLKLYTCVYESQG